MREWYGLVAIRRNAADGNGTTASITDDCSNTPQRTER